MKLNTLVNVRRSKLGQAKVFLLAHLLGQWELARYAETACRQACQPDVSHLGQGVV